MKKAIRVKKSFTLIELMIVILLTGTIYYLVFSSFSSNKEKQYIVNIENIKDFMLRNFDFEEELSLICIEDERKNCYIFVDKNITTDIKIKNLFKEIPEVYNYDKDLSTYIFNKIRIENIEYEPFFELIINSDKKHKNIVLDTLDEKVYLFSSISKKVEVFNSMNEIRDRFFDMEIEVKDAL